MTRVAVGPEAARTRLGAVIRGQLLQTWQRGMDTAPHGVNALYDKGATASFNAILDAADELTAAVANVWRTTGCPEPPAPDTLGGGSTDGLPKCPGHAPVHEAADGSPAVIHSAEAFTLAPGHRMRAARCVVCRLMIGAGEAVLVGVAPLAGGACRCGGVVSDVYLIHAVHVPMDPDDLAAAIHRGLACPVCNSAS